MVIRNSAYDQRGEIPSGQANDRSSRKEVVYLKRISMGVLTLPDDLKKRRMRQLTAEEEKRLKESVVTK